MFFYGKQIQIDAVCWNQSNLKKKNYWNFIEIKENNILGSEFKTFIPIRFGSIGK